MAAPDGPAAGALQDGYVFQGGDPSQQSSWSKAPEVGHEQDGYVFVGGHPADPGAWKAKPAPSYSAVDIMTGAPIAGPSEDDAPRQPAPAPTHQRQAMTVRPGGGQQVSFAADPAPEQPPAQSMTRAVGNAAAQGAVQGVGSGIRGVGEGVNAALNTATSQQLGIFDRIDRGETIPAMDDPVGYGDMSADQRAQTRKEFLGTQAANAPEVRAPNMLERAGTAVDRYGQSQFPVDPRNEGTATGVARTVGGVGSALPAIVLGSLAGGPAGGAAAAAATIFPQAYDSTFQAAKAKGSSDAEAHDAGMQNGIAQSVIQSVPLGRALGLVAKPLQGAFISTLKNLAEHGVTFGGVSALGRFAQNFNAQQSYDPEQKLTEGVASAALEGTVAGLIVPAAGAAVRAGVDAGRRVATPTTPTPIAEAEHTLNQIAAGQTPTAEPAPAEAATVPPAAEPPESPLDKMERLKRGEFRPSDRARNDAEAATPPPATQVQDGTTPAVEDGNARFYHGGTDYTGGSRWLTQDYAHAKGYADKSGSGVHFVDIPESDPNLVKSFDDTGTGQKAPYVHFDAPEELASKLRPFQADNAQPQPQPQPAAPTRIRTVDQIMQEDGISAAKARGVQQEEIAAVGRPISNEEREARAAGVMTLPPRPAAQPEPAAKTAEPIKAYTAAGTSVAVRPELVDLSSLVPSNAPDGRINPDYPHDLGLQPRDRTNAASQVQVQDIVSKFEPERLAPGADASTGAPIVGPSGVVESGNGRTMALTRIMTDPALRPQRDRYMAWLEDQGYDLTGMQNPVLVSRRVGTETLSHMQRFTTEANDRGTLAMNPAEQARADAGRAGDAMNLWRGSSVTAATNQGFVRAFMQQLPASERGSMQMPGGELSPDGQQRITRAVMAHAYGDQMGVTLDKFLQSDSEGMKNIAGAMSDVSGDWSQMRASAARGEIAPELDATPALAEATDILARAKQTNIPVRDLVSQTDFDRPPPSPLAVKLLQAMFRDPEMTKPLARTKLADWMAEYVAAARKQMPTLVGDEAKGPDQIIEQLKGDGGASQVRMFSKREGDAAEQATAARQGASQEANDHREAMYRQMQALMRHFGLPSKVGLKLVDRIVDAAAGGGADASYYKGLVTYALDTQPGDAAAKLFHEVVHALRDPGLGLLTSEQNRALDLAADRYLSNTKQRAALERAYGKDPDVLREEAISRLAEGVVKQGARAPSLLITATRNMVNTVRALGQSLRGEGYTTADDVFKDIRNGRVSGDGFAEAETSYALRPAAAEPKEQPAEPTVQNDPRQMPLFDAGHTEAPAQAEAQESARPAAGEGQLFSKRDTDTPDFRRWFGESKAVDADGSPKRLYHGTGGDIHSFDSGRLGEATGAPSARKGFFFTDRPKTADYYSAGGQDHFGPAIKEAERAARNDAAELRAYKYDPEKLADVQARIAERAGPNVVPVYLSLQNPLVHDFKGRVFRDESYNGLIDRATAEGHDGLILRNTFDAGEYGRLDALMRGRIKPEDVYVALKPEQIKSATGNRGTFDAQDPRINYSKRDQGVLPDARPRPFAERSKAHALADAVQQVLSPTSREGAKPMEYIVRGSAADIARSKAQSFARLEDFSRQVDRLPVDEQLAITDRYERGEKQPTPELQAVVDGVGGQLKLWTKKIQELGRGIGKPLLKDANENYMGRQYVNYDEWRRGEAPGTPEEMRQQLKSAFAAGQSKGPIRGSGAFLKQRTFETQREAMDAGLVPVETNPVKMQLLKLSEMQKFYHGTILGETIKDSHMAQWVPEHETGEARKNGLVKLEDPIFQPRIRSADQYGVNSVGGWYSPEPVARIFNNYVSKGLAGNPIYDTIRKAGNALTMAQLSLSAYHATFVTLDAMQSTLALGLQQLSRGDIGRAALSVAKTPFAIIPTVRAGARLRQMYLTDQSSLPPEARKLVNALTTAGGRIAMDGFHSADQSGAFFKNLGDVSRLFTNPGDIGRDIAGMFKATPWTAVPRIAGRLAESLMQPIMGGLVPRAKLGVFYNMAEDFMRRNPEATQPELAAEMTRIWDSVDNRMGQMVYDNLFWNKTTKDLAFISTRSVGWNLGTIREIGGAGVDAVTQLANLRKMQKPELTNRMAYTIAMPLVLGSVGAALTYLNTGHGPQSLKDYFFPPDGKGGRLQMPGYIKDVIEYSKDAVQTIANKANPLISMLQQLHANRDYYGGIIHYAPVESTAPAYLRYLMNTAKPFSITGAQRLNAAGAGYGEQARAMLGFVPAPQSITAPERGEAFQARSDMLAYRRREKARGKLTGP